MKNDQYFMRNEQNGYEIILKRTNNFQNNLTVQIKKEDWWKLNVEYYSYITLCLTSNMQL